MTISRNVKKTLKRTICRILCAALTLGAAAFSASDSSGAELSLETASDTITAKALDTYALACDIDYITDLNAGDQFTIDVTLAGGGSKVGSVQFALTGDWYTVNFISVPNGASYSASDDKKNLAITGLDITTSETQQTVATLIAAVNTAIVDKTTEKIEFADTGNYVTAANSTGKVTPTTTTGCSANLHNITVTLNAGNAVFDGDSEKTSVTAYATYNSTGLYTDASRTNAFEFPTITASGAYRLADDTSDEPLWTDGTNNYTSSALLQNVNFSDNAAFTVNTVKTWSIAYSAGENGAIGRDGSSTADDKKPIVNLPTVTPNDNYVFYKWVDNAGNEYTEDELKTTAIVKNTVFTAQFAPASYSVSFAESELAEFTDVTGVTDGSGKYLTDITFKINKKNVEGQEIDYVYYTVSGGDKVTLTADEDGKYTIDGSTVTGNIEVSGAVVNSTFTFIGKAEYIGDNINAFDDGKKIAVLGAVKLDSGNYTLSDGKEFFYSERLGGYVIFVDTDVQGMSEYQSKTATKKLLKCNTVLLILHKKLSKGLKHKHIYSIINVLHIRRGGREVEGAALEML